MTTWAGHFVSGLGFYLVGIVFCIQISWNYFTQGRKLDRERTRGKMWQTITNFPIDSILKIAFGFSLTMTEMFYPQPGTNRTFFITEDKHWIYMNSLQHNTMYFTFIISGVVDLISRKCLRERSIVLEKAGTALAAYVLFLQLYYHGYGKSDLEGHLHGLMSYTALGIGVTFTLEIWRQEDNKLKRLRTMLFMQFGSWVFQVGYILYRPIYGIPWDVDDIKNLTAIPIFFAWNMFFNWFVMGTVHFVVYIYFKVRDTSGYKSLSNTELEGFLPSTSTDVTLEKDNCCIQTEN